MNKVRSCPVDCKEPTDLVIVCRDGHFFTHSRLLKPYSDTVEANIRLHPNGKCTSTLF